MGWATERFGKQREEEAPAGDEAVNAGEQTASVFEAPLPQGSESATGNLRSRFTRYPHLVLALAVVAIVVFVFWPKGSQDLNNSAQAKTKQPTTVRKEGKLTSPDVHSESERESEYVANASEVIETPPSPTPESAPTPYPDYSSAPSPSLATLAPTPTPQRERQYIVVMRAGTPDAEAEQNSDATIASPALAVTQLPEPRVETVVLPSPEPPGLPLPKGLRIPLRLVDPVQTGTQAFVRVRTTAKVTVSKELLIPAGTEGYISFVEMEANGRAITDPEMPGFLQVGDKQYLLQGSAYGGDRLKGLAGQRIKVKGSGRPNLLKRGLNSVAQAATSAVGSVARVPIYAGDVFDPYGRGGDAQYIVRVAEGAMFTFVIGL